MTCWGMLDAEAERRRTSRSALLQQAARRELGLAASRLDEAIWADLDELSRAWSDPTDAAR